MASATYAITLPAGTPIFSLAAGIYTSAQNVAISDTTAGATIFYTTDGSTPNMSSRTGLTASSVATAIYTITAATPTVSPSAGTYTSVQSVTLSTISTGARIYYTTDGSTPSASSTLYTIPITVSSSETINAVASLNGRLSSVLSAAYVIDLPPASISASSGSGQNIEVGNGFAAPLVVRVLNSVAMPVAGIAVSFSAPASGASVTFSSASCTTDSSGTCSITARANTSVGTYTVTSSAGTLSAAFTLTNTGLHSYVVTVSTDTTTGKASNCFDQPTNSGSANLNCSLRDALAAAGSHASSSQTASITFAQSTATTVTLANGSLVLPFYTTIQGATSGSGATLTNLIAIDGNNSIQLFYAGSGRHPDDYQQPHHGTRILQPGWGPPSTRLVP